MSATSIRLGPDRKGLSVVAEDARITYFGPEASDDQPHDPRANHTIPCPLSTLGPGKINAHKTLLEEAEAHGEPTPDG